MSDNRINRERASERANKYASDVRAGAKGVRRSHALRAPKDGKTVVK